MACPLLSGWLPSAAVVGVVASAAGAGVSSILPSGGWCPGTVQAPVGVWALMQGRWPPPTLGSSSWRFSFLSLPIGRPAASIMAAWPFAIAAVTLIRKRVLKCAVLSSSVNPSSTLPCAAALARNFAVSHSCRSISPEHISPCVVITAGKKVGREGRIPMAACRCASAMSME